MVELSFFPFVVLSFATSVKCLGVVGVVVQGSMQCCILFLLQQKTLRCVKGNNVAGEQLEDILAMQIKTLHWFILGDYVVGNFCFTEQYYSMFVFFFFPPVDFNGNISQRCKIDFSFICN